MAFVTAKDVPLYFGKTANIDSNTMPTEGDGNNNAVFATQVQLNYTPNIAIQRVVGKNPTKNNFTLAGPPNATLSFSAYVALADEFDPSDYTGDFNTGTCFKLGDGGSGISGSGAYMTSYSLTVAPYAPVIFQADFAIYQPLTLATSPADGGKIASAANSDVLGGALDFLKVGHGAYSTFNGTSLADVSIIDSVSYQYSAQRAPFYNVGSFEMPVGADGGARLLSAEHSFSFAGDNITSFVPITGLNKSLELKIKSPDTSNLLTLTVDGRLNAENVTVSAGDVARGSMTVTAPLV